MDISLTNYYALRVYLVLYNYTEEGRGLSINQIEEKLEIMFGSKSPSRNVTNQILKNMYYGTDGRIEVKQDERRRYYLANRALSDEEVSLLSEVILQSKSLNNYEKDDIGLKLGRLIGEEKMYQYKRYRSYGNLANNSSGDTISIIKQLRYANGECVKVGINTVNGTVLMVSPIEVFSRNNTMYLLYADEQKKLAYIEINEIIDVHLTETNGDFNVFNDWKERDICIENPIAYVKGERKEQFELMLLTDSKGKALKDLGREFGEESVTENPIRNSLFVKAYYSDIEKFLMDNFKQYKLFSPIRYVEVLKEKIESLQNLYK